MRCEIRDYEIDPHRQSERRRDDRGENDAVASPATQWIVERTPCFQRLAEALVRLGRRLLVGEDIGPQSD